MSKIMQRVIAHWTGGAGRANAKDRSCYHLLWEFDGTEVHGTESIEDNIVTADGDYAAHTLNLNTRSIGVACCGMHGARENPFDPGEYPVTEKAFRAMCRGIAMLCLEYGIQVTPETVLTHAEVEANLGVKQNNKWDYVRVPWRDDLRGARQVGDYMRALVAEYLGAVPAEDQPTPVATLRMGNVAPDTFVVRLQTMLHNLGYFSGRQDGLFGKRTRAAVVAFQADHDLAPDGIVGPATWQALSIDAKPRMERKVTVKDLRAAGSRTIAAADVVEDTAKQKGWFGTGGITVATVWGMVGNADETEAKLAGAETLMGKANGILTSYWPLLIIAALFLAFMHREKLVKEGADLIRKLREDDAQTGANDSR